MAREEVKNILHNMHIDHEIFSEDEKVLLEKGGYSVSDSEHIDDDHNSDDDYERKIMEVISPEIGFYGGRKSAGDFEYGERDVLEERYKFENNYLQLQMANQKAAFYKKVGELERAMDRLRREKKDYELRFIQQKQFAKEEIDKIKGGHGELLYQGPQMAEKMSAYKAGLKNLLVSEDQYIELRAIPENKRNLKEFVQVKAFELCKKFKDDIETLKRDREQINDKLVVTQEKYQKECRETERITNVLRDRETDYVNRIEELEVRNKELQEAIYKMKLKEESYKNVERDYESMKERLREFEKTNASLQIQSELQTETVKRSNDQREEYEKQYDNLRRQIDLLNQDKTFMTRENATLHDRIKRLENDIERGEDQRQKQYAELLDAKKSAQS